MGCVLGGTVGVRTRAELVLRLCFVVCDGEVKIGDCGLPSGRTVNREKVILGRRLGALARNVLSGKGTAGY